MKRRGISYAVLLALALALGPQFAKAEQPAPKDNKGFKTTKTEIVDLGPEIEGMAGRQLRLRVLQIEPGGHIGIHSHKDRPAVAYILQGTDIITSGDGTEKRLQPGDTTSATKDTTHWHRNEGKEPVVLIAVDILHPKK